MALKQDAEKMNYQLQDDGTFVIEDYNRARPFASFFPGIAGLKGIPMWAFFVNRNQGIASFGIKNKHYSITEFYPANMAYSLTATAGFRTFIKLAHDGGTVFYEPFQNAGPDSAVKQRMLIRPYEVLFQEINATLGLKVTVRYFTLPQEPIAALVRVVSFENLGSEKRTIEVVDGLPKIMPYWLSGDLLKAMSYTAQAWATVTNFAKTGLPFYKLKVEIGDRPEVTELTRGNFYFGLVEAGAKLRQADVIIDPELVFGQDLSFVRPLGFIESEHFAVTRKQMGDNKYPAAMCHFTVTLEPNKPVTLYSMAGHIESEEALNAYVRGITSPAYFTAKAADNKTIIDSLTSSIHTESAIREFDLYCRQTYLDNLLRGGMPIVMSSGDKKQVFYVYSRKHGDLERDYNFFQLSPMYYSQGNGNFRDMNQNKRSDIFFNPEIGDVNVLAFYNMVQLDGNNPLLVKGSIFSFDPAAKQAAVVLGACVEKKDLPRMKDFFAKPFEPGELLLAVEQQRIKLKVAADDFLKAVLVESVCIHEADHGEGFWTDHWTYNLDLLQSYLAIYPEKEREIFLEKKDFTWYDNAHIVVPRAEKYVNADGKIRQFDSVIMDTAKATMLRARTEHVHAVRDRQGKGAVCHTTLLAKMVCLALNKLATLDSEGIGIEMEAEKPSWYDALNGLPGVFGSSTPETFELKRMLVYIQDRLNALAVPDSFGVVLPDELASFFAGMEKLLARGERVKPFEFWDAATSMKEEYRRSIIHGINGKTSVVTAGRLRAFIAKAVRKIDRGLAKARDPKTGLYYTYFQYEALSSKPNGKVSHKGWPCVKVSRFRRKPLPLFLEAEVHYLKTEPDRRRAAALHGALKKSPLYDKALGMYKVNASLAKESLDLGRCTVFQPGWLENESIWLHMEYKYLLELLRAGLHREFFDEFKKAGICFQNPRRYGRSILENSSFIASSALPDKSNAGRGFVARLSGSTAEFIEMWIAITSGPRPFGLDKEGKLTLRFAPSIPKEYFTKDNAFRFMFLGTTQVCYHNPGRRDTFAPGTRISEMLIRWKDGGSDTVPGSVMDAETAGRVRNREAALIDVYFAK